MSSLSEDPALNIPLVLKLSLSSFPQNQVVGQLTAAQAILESGLTNKPSELAMKYCNLFGQKPSTTILELQKGTRGVVYLKTWEHIRGQDLEVTTGFLYNNDIEDSLNQHKLLFTKLYRYQNLFLCQSFEQAAKMISLDGYATDPTYSTKLINIYNEYLK